VGGLISATVVISVRELIIHTGEGNISAKDLAALNQLDAFFANIFSYPESSAPRSDVVKMVTGTKSLSGLKRWEWWEQGEQGGLS